MGNQLNALIQITKIYIVHLLKFIGQNWDETHRTVISAPYDYEPDHKILLVTILIFIILATQRYGVYPRSQYRTQKT